MAPWDPAREMSPGGMPVELFLREQQERRSLEERRSAEQTKEIDRQREEIDRQREARQRLLLLHRR